MFFGLKTSCAAKTIHLSMRHVSPCASQCTEHQRKSDPPLLCCIRLRLRLQTCCPRIHLPAAKIHGRRALLRNSTRPLVMSPKGSSSTGPCSTCQIRQLTIRMILRKLVSNRCPTANHRYIQLTNRQRALQRHPTRTSKTNNYVRCWLIFVFRSIRET